MGMGHDGHCEKAEVILTISRKLTLTRAERDRLRNADACYCDCRREGVDIGLMGPDEMASAYISAIMVNRRIRNRLRGSEVAEGKDGESSSEGEIIEVDFRNRRRLTR